MSGNNKLKFLSTTLLTVTALCLSTSESRAYSNECVKRRNGSSNYYLDCYDARGNKISQKYSSKGYPDEGAAVSSTYIYTYTTDNKVISTINYAGDPDKGVAPSWTAINDYNTKGKTISTVMYNGDPNKGATITQKYVYTYDSKGNNTSMKIYDGNPDNGAKVNEAYTYTYDANGNMISGKSYYHNSSGGGYVIDYDGSETNLTEDEWLNALANFPKDYRNRLYYTLMEAKKHVRKGNNNTLTFTFK